MVAVLFGLAIVIGAITMGFEQGQANPDAESFFSSKSTAYEQK